MLLKKCAFYYMSICNKLSMLYFMNMLVYSLCMKGGGGRERGFYLE